MKQVDKLKEFYKSLQDISLINSNLDEKRRQLKDVVHNFNISIQEKKVDKNISKQNKEIAELLETTIGLIKESSNSWLINFEEMLEKEKFRSDLANYFIIIIFGKVKAGKSSLGNFIAKHKLENQTVDFFQYDEAGKKQAIKKLEEIDDDSFDTNNLECTVEIQGFKLDGMAWVDTPGLGSMVKENGDLAKEYIQSADYAIFPTSSDSVWQLDETQQFKELLEQNKKVTICITKSDEIEEDECECGSEDGCSKCIEGTVKVLQNKPLSNREDQEAYVNEEINKIIKENKESLLGDIFSISTHTATKGLEDKDDELFEGSNIPRFYELMTKVVKEKATILKETTPYDGLKSFIDNNILGSGHNAKKHSIANIKHALLGLDQKVGESLERLTVLENNANSDLGHEVDSVIAEYSSKINKSNYKEIFATIDAVLNAKVVEVVQNNVQEIFEDFDTTLKSLTTSFGKDDFEIKDMYITAQNSTSRRNKKVGQGLLGLVATVTAGILLAPATGASSLVVAGSVVGTAFAGATGSYIGGIAGEATGSTQSEKIKVGDNKEEVIQKFTSARLDHYEKFAKDLYQKMQDTFFVPLQQTSKNITLDLEKFAKNVKNIL